ncbi:hypothetical protein [Pseudomonas edaphica]|nr:hypothetical protein [Pseudomonas edaphica]
MTVKHAASAWDGFRSTTRSSQRLESWQISSLRPPKVPLKE